MTSCFLTWRTVFPTKGILLKERICSYSFLYKMTSIYIGGSNENDRIASPERIPIHLNITVINTIIIIIIIIIITIGILSSF